jgi:hypothetical protein
VHRRILGQRDGEPDPAVTQAPTTALLPYAESPRPRSSPAAPAARAVAIASVTMDAAPFPDPALPARNRIPATTGAPFTVLNVVASGDGPRRSTCFPAILVCPKLAP